LRLRRHHLRAQIPVLIILHQRIVVGAHIDILLTTGQMEICRVLEALRVGNKIDNFDAGLCRLPDAADRHNRQRGITGSIAVKNQLVGRRGITIHFSFQHQRAAAGVITVDRQRIPGLAILQTGGSCAVIKAAVDRHTG